RLNQKFRIVVLEKSAPLNETTHNQKEQGRDCKPDAAEPLYHQVIFASDRELFAQHKSSKSIPITPSELIANPFESIENDTQQDGLQPVLNEIAEEKRKTIEKEFVETGS
ncbi:unnamed protein product, partial [Rotaria magnacalcarata]